MNNELKENIHSNEETSSEMGYVYQQSVGITVKIGSPKNHSLPLTDGYALPWMTDERASLIVVLIVAAIITILLLLFILIWKWILYIKNKNNENSNVEAVNASRFVIPNIPSHSVFLDPKTGQFVYDSRVQPPPTEPANQTRHWYYQNHLVAPQNPGNPSNPAPHSISIPPNQLLCLKVAEEEQSKTIEPEETPSSSLPPQISEFNPKCASSATILEDDRGLWNIPEDASSTLKTRSLPACVRSKLKQSASADNSNDLYSKVNFSKKRKNRMRNDEAAIIAISKSRSQYLHRDTDSLVDNEAIIVYDERTAL
nr:PREDICTED: uncharacterized protein LOC109034618 isoform X1 [Bemisia tabaci]